MSRENGMGYMYYNSRSPFDTNLHSLHSSTMLQLIFMAFIFRLKRTLEIVFQRIKLSFRFTL